MPMRQAASTTSRPASPIIRPGTSRGRGPAGMPKVTFFAAVIDRSFLLHQDRKVSPQHPQRPRDPLVQDRPGAEHIILE